MADNSDASASSSPQSKENNKKKWSTEETNKLIDAYEARPCLWDVYRPEYHDRQVTSKAKAEIEVCECKKKIDTFSFAIINVFLQFRTLKFFHLNVSYISF